MTGDDKHVDEVSSEDEAATQKADKSKRKSLLNSTLSTKAKTKKVSPNAVGAEYSADDEELQAIDIPAPSTLQTTRSEEVVRMVMLDDITEGENPRSIIDNAEYEDLLLSIKTLGIQQPILCRFNDDSSGPKYVVVAGHRRFHAARDSGMTSIPVLARNMDSTEAFVAAVAENTNRDSLTPRDLVLSYERLKEMDVPQKTIIASIGGASKTSKIRKITESKRWREEVLYNDASIRSAYEAAVNESRTEARGSIDDPDESSGPEAVVITDEGAGDDGAQEDPPLDSPPASDKPKKMKCLEATYIDHDGTLHAGHINISEITFEGDTARYTAWYPSDGGDHQIVPLQDLTILRGVVLK